MAIKRRTRRQDVSDLIPKKQGLAGISPGSGLRHCHGGPRDGVPRFSERSMGFEASVPSARTGFDGISADISKL
jgi:hypothetical protein